MPVFRRFVAIVILIGLSACASPNLSVTAPTQALPSTQAAEPAPANSVINANAVLHGAPAKPPSGYVAFCARVPDQCAMPTNAPREINLTDDVWNTLEAVNTAFNKAIAPEDDRDHYGTTEYWTIPTDGYGDCEDYVVAKRQALIKAGLPAPALRIAVVFAPHFVRHAVLTVATDKGNYVLDNLRSGIVTWDKTGYAFIERQDPASSSGWVSLE
ncbi:MAG TPA: transglutaminase-like cysteine peptidase [Micropepsaceae bacterium]|nr:transglutaminase-like cysteine peptidase [Micropepsaceae bacterium]